MERFWQPCRFRLDETRGAEAHSVADKSVRGMAELFPRNFVRSVSHPVCAGLEPALDGPPTIWRCSMAGGVARRAGNGDNAGLDGAAPPGPKCDACLDYHRRYRRRSAYDRSAVRHSIRPVCLHRQHGPGAFSSVALGYAADLDRACSQFERRGANHPASLAHNAKIWFLAIRTDSFASRDPGNWSGTIR